jgi:hypothetical protein
MQSPNKYQHHFRVQYVIKLCSKLRFWFNILCLKRHFLLCSIKLPSVLNEIKKYFLITAMIFIWKTNSSPSKTHFINSYIHIPQGGSFFNCYKSLCNSHLNEREQMKVTLRRKQIIQKRNWSKIKKISMRLTYCKHDLEKS